MIETATTEAMRQANQAAHRERALAFAALIRALTAPFHALPTLFWPQDVSRRCDFPPQACPAGQ